MWSLFHSVLRTRKHLWFMIATLVSMCLVTISSQLEMFSIGILTNKGPDVFVVFAPLEKGSLSPQSQLSIQDVEARLPEISTPEQTITHASIQSFLNQHQHQNPIASLLDSLEFHHHLEQLALFIVFVALFRAVTLFLHKLTTKFFAIKISQQLRNQYFEHLQKLPLAFFHKYHSGSLSTRVVGDASLISDAINSCLINYIQTPFTIITTLILCFFLSWQLSLVIFFGFPLIVFPITFLAKKIKKIARILQKNQEDFASAILEFLGGIQTIKLFHKEEFSAQKYKERNQQMAHTEFRAARYEVASRPIIHTIGMLFLGFSLVFGMHVLHLEVPQVLVYCGLLYIFYEPIKKFAEENTNIQKGMAALERMNEVLEVTPSIQDVPDAHHLTGFSHALVFKQVSFQYDQTPTLTNLSFEVKKGQTVALVGPTGSGKTTIAQLIPRLYSPTSGSISIDGHPIAQCTQKSLRDLISFVPQKPFLFYDTIIENIAFGSPISYPKILAAARQANAHEFIEKLPLQYHTPLAELGSNLSGGQQQRLAIARALYKNAPILILDEATSSLDSLSEHLIQQTLYTLQGELTQIIIAHRLSTIQNADKILYLENGQIISQGSLAYLLEHSTPFAKLWNQSCIRDSSPIKTLPLQN